MAFPIIGGNATNGGGVLIPGNTDTAYGMNTQPRLVFPGQAGYPGGSSGGSSGSTGGGTTTQNATSTQNTNSSRSGFSNTTNTSRTNNMSDASAAALEKLIAQLQGGGTAAMQQDRSTRSAEIAALQGQRSGYSKAAAFADSALVMDQQRQQALAQVLPSITRAAEGAGTSRNSMRALMLQKEAQQAAQSAAALGLKSATDYGNISNGMSNVLANLIGQNDPASAALLSALGIAKGAQTSTTATQNTNTGETANSTTNTNSNQTTDATGITTGSSGSSASAATRVPTASAPSLLDTRFTAAPAPSKGTSVMTAVGNTSNPYGTGGLYGPNGTPTAMGGIVPRPDDWTSSYQF